MNYNLFVYDSSFMGLDFVISGQSSKFYIENLPKKILYWDNCKIFISVLLLGIFWPPIVPPKIESFVDYNFTHTRICYTMLMEG